MGHAELEPEDIDQSISALHGAWKRTWQTFCQTTSIHGLKFTHDENSNYFIRCIWSIITVIMFTCSVLMVVTFYMDYRSSPTRMNVENNYAPISSLLFPAISICPEILFKVEKSRQFISKLKLPPTANVETIINKLNVFYGFINDDTVIPEADLSLMEQILELNGLTLLEFVKGLSWECPDIFFRCRFQGEIEDCENLFKPSRTYYGHCYSFNLNQTTETFNNLYSRPSLREGLSIILYHNDADLNTLISHAQGFHILLGEHAAFPSAHAIRKFIPPNQEAFVSIRPTETFCSRSVEALSIAERQCVLPDEFPLQHFPRYVGSNCEINCRVYNTLQYCACMPYFFYDNITTERICTFKDITCLVENFPGLIGRFRATQCQCPNFCEWTEYDAQLTSTDLLIETPTMDKFYDGIKRNYSVVHIFMKSQVYRRVRRDLLSSMVTLVSNLGSAFSLFVGMSMVSLIEIIYYFSVVLYKDYTQEVKAREKILLQPHAKVELHIENYQ